MFNQTAHVLTLLAFAFHVIGGCCSHHLHAADAVIVDDHPQPEQQKPTRCSCSHSSSTILEEERTRQPQASHDQRNGTAPDDESHGEEAPCEGGHCQFIGQHFASEFQWHPLVKPVDWLHLQQDLIQASVDVELRTPPILQTPTTPQLRCSLLQLWLV
ncbi:hypothetical protein SH668x_002975 [Planctomicrobium sp. SH668]|uniref:hypothetical protein n=1 Tax=Planctomicrobium sp. SH668 TaxID=3448126 RepID=UPI003F5B48AC